MRPKQSVLFPLISIVFCFSVFSAAQNWSGILDPSRAVDWSSTNPGVMGGIPSANWTQCGPTIAAYTGAPTAINNAIAGTAAGYTGCTPPYVIALGTGTFSLNSDIIMKSNVALRGNGPNNTILQFTAGGNGCHEEGTDDVCFSGTFNWSGGPQHLTTWTAGFSQGTTQITLGSVAGLSVGQVLILDQANDAVDTGNYYICDTTLCSSEGGSPERIVNGLDYSQQEYKTVTAINANTNAVTISPGLYSPNWGQGSGAGTTSAWWASTLIQNSGIENLTLNHGNSNNVTGTMYFNADNCWTKNVRSIYTLNSGSGAGRDHVWFQYSNHITVQDSYFFGTRNSATLSYGVETWQSGDILIQNNIFQQVVSPLLVGNTEGSVFAYNFGVNEMFNSATWNMPGPSFTHDAGTALNLFEGNQGTGMVEDNIHGTHNMDTYFRNQWYIMDNPAMGQQTIAVELAGYTREMNFIANVMGRAGYSNQYQVIAPAKTNCNTAIYNLGWDGNCQDNVDPALTTATLMRWGNWDTVSNATRWCGNSSDTGWSSTCGSTSEIPTGLAKFSNPVPTKGDTAAGQAPLPASFYLNSAPAFFITPQGIIPFPPVGPDVTGGNVTSGTGTGSNLGGHAYLIPARNCYLNVMAGPVGGTGSVLPFDAGNCYGSSPTAPPPPTGLNAIVH